MPPKTNEEIVEEFVKALFPTSLPANELIDAFKNHLSIILTQKDKEKEEAVAAAEKAYGGCHYCYGKGYGTQTAAWVGRGYYKKLPTMKFCTCERGEQLKSLLTPPLPDQGDSK